MKTKLIFEKYQLSPTSNISSITSSYEAFKGCSLESSQQADFKTTIGCQIWSRFHVQKGQKLLLQSKGGTLYVFAWVRLVDIEDVAIT